MKRIINTTVEVEEEKTDAGIRPVDFKNYIGQDKLKDNLKIYINAAKNRNESLDHVLLYGPPGLGKTTLAGIIARQMGVNIKITSGPAILIPGDMAAILSQLKPGDILFVDEIHRLNRQIEEILYPAMEDFALDIIIGKGQQSKSMRLELPKFTLIGATTRAGLLSAPLRDRFGVIGHMDFYSDEELSTIIKRTAKLLNIKITENGAMEIAKRSRGTPRLANRLLKRVRDFAQIKFAGNIDDGVADYALNLIEIDKNGLDKNDRNIITTMIDFFNGGPVGIEALAASLGDDVATIEDVYEPFLLQKGFIKRTPRGRVVSDSGYQAVGIKYDKDREIDDGE